MRRALERPANALAGLWGLAEATLFFIVPDVLLSWLAMRGLRAALVACLFALCVALIGGSVIWMIAQQEPELLRRLFVSIPAIDGAMLASVAFYPCLTSLEMADGGLEPADANVPG